MRYYVYALIDPRDGGTFYIGKGQGNRMYQHEREVRRGQMVNAAKSARIAAILAAGMAVQCSVLARFDVEAEAYAAERTEIAARVGLTNGNSGGAGGGHSPSSVACKLLARVKPYVDWLNEEYRSDADQGLYQFVVKNLQWIASCGVSKHAA